MNRSLLQSSRKLVEVNPELQLKLILHRHELYPFQYISLLSTYVLESIAEKLWKIVFENTRARPLMPLLRGR